MLEADALDTVKLELPPILEIDTMSPGAVLAPSTIEDPVVAVNSVFASLTPFKNNCILPGI